MNKGKLDEEYGCYLPEVVSGDTLTSVNNRITLLVCDDIRYVVSKGFDKELTTNPRRGGSWHEKDCLYEDAWAEIAKAIASLFQQFPDRIDNIRDRFSGVNGIDVAVDQIIESISAAKDRHDERLRRWERAARAELRVTP